MKIPKINDVIGLLYHSEPGMLKDLNLKFPDYKEVLKPGEVLGSYDDIQSADSKTMLDDAEKEKIASDLMVRATVCLAGLRAVLKICDVNLPPLKKRLKRLGNIQLASQLIVAISGATLLTKEGSTLPYMNIVIGLLTLIGSILTLYIQHKSGTVLNNSQSIFSMYNTLIDHRFAAEALKQEIEIEMKIFDQHAPPEKLLDMINQANKICLEIKVTLEKI